MNRNSTPFKSAMLGLALTLIAAPVLAEKPDHAGKGGNKHAERFEDGDRDRGGYKQGRGNGPRDDDYGRDRYDDRGRQDKRGHGPDDAHFQRDKRMVVRDYYDHEFRSGHCPPGLAKKRNGCQPPGQAKKWRKGYPLPRDVVYYDLPEALIIQLGRPPVGHRYVRVGLDILMIAVGTSMVVDAIEDLGRL